MRILDELYKDVDYAIEELGELEPQLGNIMSTSVSDLAAFAMLQQFFLGLQTGIQIMKNAQSMRPIASDEQKIRVMTLKVKTLRNKYCDSDTIQSDS